MVAGAPPFYSKDQGKMFRNRINKPIEMKEHFSTNIRDLLKKLLENNVAC
jgi:serum/glucocorticoid-regulated kinase 2